MAASEKYNVGSTTVSWYGDDIVVEIARATVAATRKAANVILQKARRMSPVGDDHARNAYKKGPYAGKRFTARIPGTLKKSGFAKRAKKYAAVESGIVKWRNIPKTLVKYQVVFGGVEQASGAKTGVANTGGRLGQRLAYYARFATWGAMGKVGYRWKKVGGQWVKYKPPTYGKRYVIPGQPFIQQAATASRGDVMAQFQNAMGTK